VPWAKSDDQARRGDDPDRSRGRRAGQREADRLVNQAAEGKIPFERETLFGLLDRWLERIEARSRAPKTLLENHRMASVICKELGSKELRKLRGRDLDSLYDGLRGKGLSATSIRRYHAVLSASLNQAVKWGLLDQLKARTHSTAGSRTDSFPSTRPASSTACTSSPRVLVARVAMTAAANKKRLLAINAR
jgi:hypothetical protein